MYKYQRIFSTNVNVLGSNVSINLDSVIPSLDPAERSVINNVPCGESLASYSELWPHLCLKYIFQISNQRSKPKIHRKHVFFTPKKLNRSQVPATMPQLTTSRRRISHQTISAPNSLLAVIATAPARAIEHLFITKSPK